MDNETKRALEKLGKHLEKIEKIAKGAEDFEPECDYCGKPITKQQFMVHVRYYTKRGVVNEYYHKEHFNRFQF